MTILTSDSESSSDRDSDVLSFVYLGLLFRAQKDKPVKDLELSRAQQRFEFAC